MEVQLTRAIHKTSRLDIFNDPDFAHSFYNPEKAVELGVVVLKIGNNASTQPSFHMDKTLILLIITILAITTAGILFINNRLKSKAINLLNKKLEKDQEQKNHLLGQSRQMVELDTEKDNFLSLVTHDLKSPLNKILGLTNLINATGPLNEEQKGYLALMGRILNDARRLIENILELSLLESGKLIFHCERIEICEFLWDLIEEYKNIAQQKKINIKIQTGEAFSAVTNRDFIIRIVDNLLSNAIKFSPIGKDIEIECKKDENDFFILAIKDHGPGIKLEEKERLFMKYQKLSAKPTAGESSTGLGLAIVKLLVNYLEGEIEVKSIEKVGTTFIVRLPLEYQGSHNEKQ